MSLSEGCQKTVKKIAIMVDEVQVIAGASRLNLEEKVNHIHFGESVKYRKSSSIMHFVSQVPSSCFLGVKRCHGYEKFQGDITHS